MQQFPRSSHAPRSSCDQCCWNQLAARPIRLLIAISVLVISSSLLYFASTSVELMQTVSTISDYSTVHPARPWKRKLIEKRLSATTSIRSAETESQPITRDETPLPAPPSILLNDENFQDAAFRAPIVSNPAPTPVVYHDPDLSSCAHLSPDARTSFLQSARALRDPVTKSPTANPPSIPKQMLWNFGLWDRSGSEPLESHKYESADGIVLYSSHPYLATLPPSVREVLNCWIASHPPEAGWKHLIWNRASSIAFMHKYYNDLLPIYESFNRIVQRSDLLRVLFVQQFGGIYMDVDVRTKQEPLESLWKEFTTSSSFNTPLSPTSLLSAAAAASLPTSKPALALFFEETVLSPSEAQHAANMYPIRKGQPEECQRMANYLLASSAQHSIWAGVLQKIQERHAMQISSDYDVLYTTGPALLTEVVYTTLGALPPTGSNFQGCILASDYSLGATSPPSADSRFIEARKSIRVVQRPQDQRWFDHMVKGTWRHAADRN